jgi:uncharacterized protein
MAKDPSAAIAFYTKLIGWGTAPFEIPGAPPYTMWMLGADPLGGTMQQRPGGDTTWLAYVVVPSVDDTVRLAEKLGGAILQSAYDIPTVGRIAVIADPQGAAFAAFAPLAEPADEVEPKVGEFMWHELATTDVNAALAFDQQLFGWDKGSGHDMGEWGIYQLFGRNGKDNGGIYRLMPRPGAKVAWLHYIRVASVDDLAPTVKALGGKVDKGPMDVPGGGRIIMGVDPQGADFALVSG